MTLSPCFFVYAAERSGTTVFRLMLNAHPGIHNPIEADFLFDHIHRQSNGRWAYDTEVLSIDRIFEESQLRRPDPLPDGPEILEDFMRQFASRKPGLLSFNIHRNLPKAATLRPDAKIIHLLRDPRDVARSSMGMGWAGLPHYGVEKWHVAERDWDAHVGAFAPLNVLELRYEDLITEPEAHLRKVCAFLDLPFDPAMLRYHENTTYDAPDPSLIYQWREKMAERDAALVEARLGSLLTSRGYEPSGAPSANPGALTRLGYWAQNKWAVWRMSSERYGFLNVLMEKVGRRLGLKSVRHRAQRKINAAAQSQVK